MKNISEMTPDEEQEYIDRINEDFRYYIEAIPFIELGEEPEMQTRKMRTHVHEGTYSMGDIMFELQWMLHIRKKNHPKTEKMIVSELFLTQDIFDPNYFCPLRGVMMKMKYVTNKMTI